MDQKKEACHGLIGSYPYAVGDRLGVYTVAIVCPCRWFSLRDFEHLTGLGETIARTALEPFVDRGWITLDDTSVRCSDKGYLFIDEILQSLLPEPATNGHHNQSRSA